MLDIIIQFDISVRLTPQITTIIYHYIKKKYYYYYFKNTKI